MPASIDAPNSPERRVSFFDIPVWNVASSPLMNDGVSGQVQPLSAAGIFWVPTFTSGAQGVNADRIRQRRNTEGGRPEENHGLGAVDTEPVPGATQPAPDAHLSAELEVVAGPSQPAWLEALLLAWMIRGVGDEVHAEPDRSRRIA